MENPFLKVLQDGEAEAKRKKEEWKAISDPVIEWHDASECPPDGEDLLLLSLRYDALITFGFWDQHEDSYFATGGDCGEYKFYPDFWAKAPSLPRSR